MNFYEAKEIIMKLSLHYGERVSCECLNVEGDKWLSKNKAINTHFLQEVINGNIRNIKLPDNGVELIVLERERQISKEGWDAAHDDAVNKNEELAEAAAMYALPEIRRPYPLEDHWPWDIKWWKPTPDDRIKELTKAGALIAAEIDRLLRLEAKNTKA